MGASSDSHESVVDELFGALKGGNYFKTRRVGGPTNPVPPASPKQDTSELNSELARRIGKKK